MKSFLLKVLLFVSLIFVVDRAVYYLLQINRPIDYKYFLDQKKTFFSENKKVDLLIIGDSHIADALDPRILEKETGLSSYNLGVYHSTPFEYYYTVKAALSQLDSPPKYVVIGTNPLNFEKPLSKGTYTPVIIDDFVTKYELLSHSDEGFGLSLFLKSPDESYLFSFVKNQLLGKEYVPTREIVSAYKGHLEFYNSSANSWNTGVFNSFISANKRIQQATYFNLTIQELKSRGIEVIIVNSPIWYDVVDQIEKKEFYEFFIKQLDTIASTHQISIFNRDHRLLQDRLQKDDFLNSEHLNYKGAKKFTNKFALYLDSLNEFKLLESH